MAWSWLARLAANKSQRSSVSTSLYPTRDYRCHRDWLFTGMLSTSLPNTGTTGAVMNGFSHGCYGFTLWFPCLCSKWFAGGSGSPARDLSEEAHFAWLNNGNEIAHLFVSLVRLGKRMCLPYDTMTPWDSSQEDVNVISALGQVLDRACRSRNTGDHLIIGSLPPESQLLLTFKELNFQIGRERKKLLRGERWNSSIQVRVFDGSWAILGVGSPAPSFSSWRLASFSKPASTSLWKCSLEPGEALILYLVKHRD